MFWFFIVVGALLLLIATPIAIFWWRLAAKAAPYRDESGKPTATSAADESDVIVIPSPDPAKRGAP